MSRPNLFFRIHIYGMVQNSELSMTQAYQLITASQNIESVGVAAAINIFKHILGYDY